MHFEITVADVRPAQMGKKTGTVKDSTGKYWSVWADKMHDFMPGNRIMVGQTRAWTSPQGKVFNTIMDYQLLGKGGGGTASSVLSRAQGGAPTIQADDRERQLHIFVCGAFNNFMSNPNVDVRGLTMMDMIDSLHKFKGAWLGVFGPSPLPTRPKLDPSISSGTGPAQGVNDDINDEVPF